MSASATQGGHNYYNSFENVALTESGYMYDTYNHFLYSTTFSNELKHLRWMYSNWIRHGAEEERVFFLYTWNSIKQDIKHLCQAY